MDKSIIPGWKWGVPRDVLVIHSKEIGEFLQKNKLKPFKEIDVLENIEVRPTSKKAVVDTHLDLAIQQKLPDYSIYGGMKIAHLHYNGEIFMLSQKQWTEFSEIMLGKIREKLANTKAVSFDELMELSSVIGNL